MRLLAWALLGATLLLALLWVVPPALNWNAHRNLIARFASAELGRQVEIDGPVALSLLPHPVFSAQTVRMNDRGDGVSVVAPALRMQLAPWPLLVGHIVPRSLTLTGARIALPWPLPPAAFALSQAALDGVRSARLENATLSAGRLTLTGVNATLSANIDAPGQLNVAGTARALGHGFHFAIRLDPPDNAGNTPITLAAAALPVTEATRHAEDFGLHWQGVWHHDGQIGGHVTAHAASLAGKQWAGLLPATLDGTMALAGARATGTMQLSLGQARATLALTPTPDGAQGIAITAPALDLRPLLAVLRPTRPGLPWSVPDVGLRLDLALDTTALRLPGATLGDVHAAGRLSPGGQPVLDQFSALLPGQARLTLSGKLAHDPMLSFAGPFQLDAPDLRQTLAWLAQTGLGLKADWPAGVLREARLAGTVRATKLAVQLDGLTGTIDASQVSGQLGVDPASGALTAALTTPSLAADDWLPPAGLPAWPDISKALSGLDLSLKLTADQVTLRGRTLTGVTLDAATNKGGLSVNQFAARLNGLTLTGAGTLAADGTVSGTSIDLAADHAGALSAVFAHLPRFTPTFWATPLNVHIDATGPRAAVLAGIGVAFGDARLEAHPTINLTNRTWSTQLTLRHPGAARLLQMLGWASAPTWLGDGSLSLLAQLSGTPDGLAAQSYDLTAASLHATGSAHLALPPRGPPSLTGTMQADTLPLPGFAARATSPLPLDWTSALDGALSLTAKQVTFGGSPWLADVTGNASVHKGKLAIAVASARLDGGALAGQVTIDPTKTPAMLSASVKLDGVTLPGPLFGTRLDLVGGKLDAVLNLTAQGNSPNTWLASLSGSLSGSAANGALGGVDLSAAPDAPLGSGATSFSTLTAKAAIANGVITLSDVTLTDPAGPVQMTGMIDLPDARLSVLATMADGHATRLLGPFNAPTRR